MARLEIILFGGFQVRLDGSAVTHFESDKVRALLAYLAVEGDRPHRREALAALLWPDWPLSAARTNLRRALCNLRGAIGDACAAAPFLTASRQQIGLNEPCEAFCDVAVFSAIASRLRRGSAVAAEEAACAVALYRSRFLEGFFLHDSPDFERWSLAVAERTRRQAAALCGHLAALYAQQGTLPAALSHARRRVELEPWDEGAVRALMRLLAADGQRAAALQQYEQCRQLLQAELGVAPAEATERLYRQIR